jgi:CO/xanthine dehydrogenase FAD-binding subunit
MSGRLLNRWRIPGRADQNNPDRSVRMPLVTAYHRPETLEQALSLLAESHRTPLGGGTVVNADRAPSALEVVDLQALGLNGMSSDGLRVRIGAMATLDDVSSYPGVPDLVRRLARAELPSTLRTIATLGGTVAGGEADSAFLAALLVHDAVVEMAGSDDSVLEALLESGVPSGAIIKAVTIECGGDSAMASTGRTPADTPIVAVVGRRTASGLVRAASGVATRPVLLDPEDVTHTLNPTGDFRGSAAYRLELVRVLAARVSKELG